MGIYIIMLYIDILLLYYIYIYIYPYHTFYTYTYCIFYANHPIYIIFFGGFRSLWGFRDISELSDESIEVSALISAGLMVIAEVR